MDLSGKKLYFDERLSKKNFTGQENLEQVCIESKHFILEKNSGCLFFGPIFKIEQIADLLKKLEININEADKKSLTENLKKKIFEFNTKNLLKYKDKLQNLSNKSDLVKHGHFDLDNEDYKKEIDFYVKKQKQTELAKKAVYPYRVFFRFTQWNYGKKPLYKFSKNILNKLEFIYECQVIVDDKISIGESNTSYNDAKLKAIKEFYKIYLPDVYNQLFLIRDFKSKNNSSENDKNNNKDDKKMISCSYNDSDKIDGPNNLENIEENFENYSEFKNIGSIKTDQIFKQPKKSYSNLNKNSNKFKIVKEKITYHEDSNLLSESSQSSKNILKINESIDNKMEKQSNKKNIGNYSKNFPINSSSPFLDFNNEKSCSEELDDSLFTFGNKNDKSDSIIQSSLNNSILSSKNLNIYKDMIQNSFEKENADLNSPNLKKYIFQIDSNNNHDNINNNISNDLINSNISNLTFMNFNNNFQNKDYFLKNKLLRNSPNQKYDTNLKGYMDNEKMEIISISSGENLSDEFYKNNKIRFNKESSDIKKKKNCNNEKSKKMHINHHNIDDKQILFKIRELEIFANKNCISNLLKDDIRIVYCLSDQKNYMKPSDLYDCLTRKCSKIKNEFEFIIKEESIDEQTNYCGLFIDFKKCITKKSEFFAMKIQAEERIKQLFLCYLFPSENLYINLALKILHNK